MLSLFKDCLLNIFFLLLPVFVLALWLEERNVFEQLKKLLTIVSLLLAMFFCITFPINVDNDHVYDLHQVLLWIGSLYYGPVASLFLSLFTIGYYAVFGKGEWVVVMLSSFVIMFISILLMKPFLSLSPKQRVLLLFSLAAFSGLLTFSLSDISLTCFSCGIVYFVIQPLSAAMACYLKEMVEQTIGLRKRLMRAEKMEVVSHLAASISHEVRNPLTAARGFMQLLAQSQLPMDKRKQYMQIAIEEIDRAEAIITDYLTFAKPSPEQVEKLNVKAEIERVIDVLRPFANMNSVEIRSSLIPFHVFGERDKFQQCLLNIMKNSIEAMPNGGTLDVYVSIGQDEVLIRITDTGIGMTKEQIERLGEPYFTTKGMKGTGLGMMVVYRIIESMGGSIEIISEVNKGTEISLSLPLAKTVAASAKPVRSLALKGKG
ncbi:two-component system sporulation sensor kinase B [Anoxybacillus voinovskiensis]|uniref:histidine kinase n=1 Tax=Anoxybacteroides voinovskiense TaxID=230470 RepID=A0A840DKY0_9BACL|nr:ATP-binding protein [Anoxybacillus voinovskiensis]MBB4072363.1 two-component system sporulation sensor kinase B [Anoxybacillus voinovskiensis]GGJ58508.1 sensor histidine kinase [Anoxybacillus voinovskiensis]